MINLREGLREDHPTLCVSRLGKFFFDFIISNEISDPTIVKSKIPSHLVLPMKNASKNSLNGPF